ncbi:MAG: dipeptide epimerase [Clostridia bacterium BRH_c25]|nr:MAG: dipeptide epimerase [Clostridia bacterium BRH_c25]
MKITHIETMTLTTPLKKPFKTALRQTSVSESIIVKIHTDDGQTGFGGAPPTAVITGDTMDSINGAVLNFISPAIVGMDIEEFDPLMKKLHSSLYKNSSAKAAVDIALYDLYGKLFKMPLYKLFGGASKEIESDITISVNSPEEMVEDAIAYVQRGYTILKTKVGLDSELDIVRVKRIREAVGSDIRLILDANQGWNAKEAVRAIRKLEDMGMNIELVEQPVKAHDIEGLKYVTDNVETPIMADESLFSPEDGFRILKLRAADILNIKLMKCGGLHNALKINAMAESCGVECMMGSMIESKIGITAAAHLACGKLNITRADLDAVDLMAEDPIDGGVRVAGSRIVLPESCGLGINGLK